MISPCRCVSGGRRALLAGLFAASVGAETGENVLFVDSGQLLGAANSLCVAVADVDGDGDGDAIVANDDVPSELWINDGTATFVAGPMELPGATCVALADLDDDGDADALLTGDRTMLFSNDGKGGFSASGAPLVTPGAVGVALGDVDGDRDVDLVIATWGHPDGLPNQVWLNEGEMHFVLSRSTVGSAVSMSVALGDVDGDGDLDALVGNQADADHDPISDELWLNDGTGGFADSGYRLGASTTYEVCLADLDADGDLDAIAANSSHAGKSDPSNRVWLNDGSGHFTDSGQRLGQEYSLSVALGDLDGDGDLDAYVGNFGQNDSVWLNDGKGRFTIGTELSGSQNGHDIALADLDGDGDLDAFVANNTWSGGSGVNRVWLNDR